MTEKRLTNNYLPDKPKFFSINDKGNLHTTLQLSEYNRILSDTDKYFSNVLITNFDLIHNKCRGDELSKTKKFYETIYKKDCDESFLSNVDKHKFIESAFRSDRNDVHFEKELLFENIKRISLKKKLAEKNIFLSSMDRRKKYTDDFNILKF